MGRRRTGIEEKIMESAGELFYLNGYPNTGIAEIVQKAGTNKTSFYQYYSSKDELGLKYVAYFSRGMLRKVIRLMRKYSNPGDFSQSWFALVSRNMKKSARFNGCPVANFSAQLESGKETENEYIRGQSGRWIKVLAVYFRQAIASGHLSKELDPEQLAEMLFIAYHGALVSWRLTGNMNAAERASCLFSGFIKKNN